MDLTKMPTEQSVVLNWIQNHEESLIKLIQELVRIPSVSGHESDVQSFLFQKLTDMGLQPKLVYPDVDQLRQHEDYFETTSFVKYGYKDRPNVTGLWKGTGEGRSFCLSGHVDVVSPEPIDEWSNDPWGGAFEEGYVYGRGAGDMKAGVAAMLIAVQALQATNTRLKGDVFVETTIEEEDGGVGGNLFMRMTQPKADAAIIPEPSAHTISVASAGVMYFRINITGIPAHAATAHFGINAIYKTLPIIEALRALNKKRQMTIHYPYAESDPRMKGRATTINIGHIRAGDWPSTVPALCQLEGRIGWPPGESREEIRNQIEEAVYATATKDPWLKEHLPQIQWFGWNARPHELDPNHPFVQLLSNQIVQLTGNKPSYIGGSAGLDTRYFVFHGIPAVTFGPLAERIHSSDERVNIESTVKVAQVLAKTLMEWCGVNNQES
jgi:acetylornithine deacetylase